MDRGHDGVVVGILCATLAFSTNILVCGHLGCFSFSGEFSITNRAIKYLVVATLGGAGGIYNILGNRLCGGVKMVAYNSYAFNNNLL
jgi:hypothetical protein